MADEQKKPEFAKPIAKGALQLLREELSKGRVERSVTLFGHEWTLRTIDEDANSWAMMFARTTNPLAMLQSLKAPKLATAIVAVDGVPTTELFEYPADMPAERKRQLDSNHQDKVYWSWQQMLSYLIDLDPKVVNDLYDEYAKLDKEREEALAALPNS